MQRHLRFRAAIDDDVLARIDDRDIPDRTESRVLLDNLQRAPVERRTTAKVADRAGRPIYERAASTNRAVKRLQLLLGIFVDQPHCALPGRGWQARPHLVNVLFHNRCGSLTGLLGNSDQRRRVEIAERLADTGARDHRGIDLEATFLDESVE